jgi:hypothetical protein
LNEEKEEIAEEQQNVMGVLLAFLWASEQGLLNSATLLDVAESPHLNHRCKLIAQKIRSPVTTTSGGSGDAGSAALATQSSMLSVQKNKETRKADRAEDESAKSLVRNLSPRQQTLFTKLCTTHVHKEPVMPEFVKACLAEKAPHRAMNLIAQKPKSGREHSPPQASLNSSRVGVSPRKGTKEIRAASRSLCFTHSLPPLEAPNPQSKAREDPRAL